MDYDTEKYPRLKYDVTDLHMGIGTLCILDLEENQMGVMLQGKQAHDEIIRLRRVVANKADDGRPCNTDVFLVHMMQHEDDHFDRAARIRDWLEGDWDAALEDLPKLPKEVLR